VLTNFRIFISGAAVLAFMPIANAQVEEITVSAQRRDASLQEVPISVSAFTADDIGKLQIDIAADISAAVPNMQMYTVTANASAMQVFMRGAGVQNPGFNAFERIEVLRGPQGTLYGRNTIAGAVKFISRTPGDEFWANAGVGYGEFETTKLTASVGGPLVEGKLGGSIAALYNDRGEGWITRGSTGGRKLGEFDNKAARGKLHWYAGNVFDAVLSVSVVDAENDGYNAIPYGPEFGPPNGPSNPGQPLEGFYDSLVPDETIGFGKTKQVNTSLNLAWSFDVFTFRSITGYSDIDDEFNFDLNGGAFQNNTPVFTGVPGLYVDSESNNKTLSQEFNFSGSAFNDRLEWIAGVFYMNEEGEQQYQVLADFDPNDNAIILLPAFTENVDTETDSFAVYGEGTWAFTDKLGLTLGARWTEDQKDYLNNCVGGFCVPVDQNAPPFIWQEQQSRDFDEFTPKAVLEYQWLDNLLVFGSVSQGFQAGGFQTLCFGNQACNQVVYEPQTVTSWEAGIKTDLFGETVRINASTFLAQYEDVQQTAVDTNIGAFPLVNAGDVDVEGFELEAYWSPNEIFNAFLIYGYGKEDFDSATTVLLQTDRLPGLPRNTLRVGFEIQVPAFANWDWLMGADVNYVDDYISALAANPNDILTIDSFTRTNARFGLLQPDGNWSVILAATNITDEESLFSGIVGSGTNIRTPQPPREWMMSVNYKY
jgi:iron complex outermembrane receptor protein